MSVLNKIPFINTVLNELGEENLGTLRSLMNGSGDRTELLRTMNVPAGNRTRISVSDKGVHLCSLQVGPTLYHGYLLYTDEQCLLIHFTDFQSLSMFSIDVAHNELRTVTEYLDINELRYIVNDLLVEAGELIKVGIEDIDSGDAVAGLAMITDGLGGAEWVEPQPEHVVVYTDVTLTDNETSLTVSQNDWLLMTDHLKDCSLIVEFASASEPRIGRIELKRIGFDSDYVEFGGSVNVEVDGNGKYMILNYSARFASTGGRLLITELEANRDLSESTEEFAELQNLVIGGDIYLIPQGTPVNANPELEGGEAELLSLQVNETKFRIPLNYADDGVTFAFTQNTGYTYEDSYSSYNRVGKEITFVVACSITNVSSTTYEITLGSFNDIPNSIFEKLIPTSVGGNPYLVQNVIEAFDDEFSSVLVPLSVVKGASGTITIRIDTTNLIANTKYHIREQITFLLTDNLSRIDAVLSNNNWDTIREVCEAGDAANYWAVGDTKTDVGTDGYTRTFRISDMSGLYGKHVVFEQVNLDGTDGSGATGMAWDANGGTNYLTSNANVTHLPAIMLRYSSELQNSLTNTTIKVATAYNNSTIQDVTAKLFLMAEKEIWTSRTYSLQAEWDALTTFSYYTTHTSNSDHIKYDSSATARYWWLRSPYDGDAYICNVDYYGSAGYYYPSSTYRFAPCFSY